MKQNKDTMFILGITGGIGSGKTTVLNILKEDYQAFIIEADALAHDLMQPEKEAYQQIVKCFGTEILNEDRTIDRTALGQLVFTDRKKLAQLNGIVHPAVKKDILRQIQEQTELGCRLLVIEAALLLEDGYQDICSEIWYVRTETEIRIQRLCQYRNFTRERALNVIHSQMNDTYYQERCQFTLDNSGNQEDLRRQICQKLNR